jgi:16S rRNA processing protein RimM
VTGPIPTSTSSTTDPDDPGRPSLLEVGSIAKPHGLNGEVVVALITNRTERLEPGTTLSTSSDSDLVVVESKPFKGRFIVRFEGVADLEGAERLRGLKLFAAPIDEPDALWVDSLVGAVVEDRNGRSFGKVVSVVANPASDLLELEGGGLVPLVFVVENSPGRILVDLPEGLLE